MKQSINIFFLVLFLGVAGYAGYKFFFENNGPSYEPLRATPGNAVAFVTGDDLVAFYRETDNTSLLWQDLKSSGFISTFDGQLDVWNTLDKKGALKKTGKIPFVLSLHAAGDHRFDYLLSLAFNQSSDQTMKDLFEQAGVQVSDEQQGIKKIKSPNNVTWYYYSYENLVLFSPSAELMAEARKECEAPGEEEKFTGFHRLRSTIGDHVKSSFFVRNAEYIALVSSHFNADVENLFNRYNTGLAGLYDVVVEPNSFLLRGFNWAPDSLATPLKLLSGQKPIKPNLVKQLPENTQWFYYLGLSNFEKYIDQLHDLPGMRSNIEAFNSEYNVNLRQHLLSWVDKELVYFSTSAFPKEKLLIMQTDASGTAQKELDFLVNQIDSSGTSSINYKGLLIRRINEAGLFSLLLGDVFKLDQPYYVQSGQSIVFSSSSDALIDYLNAVGQERFLVRDVQFYDNLENYFNTTASVLFHTSFTQGNESWRLLDSVKGNLLRDVSFIKNTSSFTFSLSHRTKDLYYTQALLKYKGSSSTATNTIWDVSFDTLLQNRPHLIHNHITGTENIVIQDRSNVLHSLSATGKTEFTVKLSDKIVGDIVNVDILKNGKNQLLFVTSGHLHIIDLKGNYVSGFPAKLPATATSTPAVYDYENDGNYRILIPSGKKILNYNREGKPVTGFMFSELPANITQPPVFSRIDNKDYLFICDETGNVKLTDRKGNDRYPVKFTLRNRGANAVYFQKGSTVETSKIVYCTNNGTIYMQYMNGMLDSLPAKTRIRNGYGFIDADDDGVSELVVVDSSKIKLFDFKGKLIKEMTPVCSDFGLQVYKAGHGKAIIGGTCKEAEMITAFDNQGNDVTRIKLIADSPFTVADINHDDKPEIVYCYRNRIFVYTLR